MLATAPWLVLAGLVEGFVTPHHLPLVPALAIGVGGWRPVLGAVVAGCCGRGAPVQRGGCTRAVRAVFGSQVQPRLAVR